MHCDEEGRWSVDMMAIDRFAENDGVANKWSVIYLVRMWCIINLRVNSTGGGDMLLENLICISLIANRWATFQVPVGRLQRLCEFVNVLLPPVCFARINLMSLIRWPRRFTGKYLCFLAGQLDWSMMIMPHGYMHKRIPYRMQEDKRRPVSLLNHSSFSTRPADALVAFFADDLLPFVVIACLIATLLSHSYFSNTTLSILSLPNRLQEFN